MYRALRTFSVIPANELHFGIMLLGTGGYPVYFYRDIHYEVRL